MHQISAAIQLYADDHEDLLPGPVDVGVPINYDDRTSVLPYYIAKYLGLPAPSKKVARAQQLVCAGYQVEAPSSYSDPLQARCYSLNWTTNTSADAWLPFKAFGYTTPLLPPHKLTEVSSLKSPSQLWAMQDVDQVIVNAKSWAWYPNLPKAPTHHAVWNRLYFDWHVASVDNPDHATTGLNYSP